MDKPSIVYVIKEHLDLRKAGKEYVGRCPFHADRTPSFSVNEAKGVFYCHGCHVSGDVIDFLIRLVGLSFREACARLGMNSHCTRSAKSNIAVQHAAAKLAAWLNAQHLKCGILLRELSQQIAIAQQTADSGLLASLTREWEILSEIYLDLQHPDYAHEFLQLKGYIESITRRAEPESPPEFPPLTDEYRSYLRLVC